MKLRYIFLIIAGVLIVVGGILLVIGITNNKKEEMVTKTYNLNEQFENIDINLETSNILFVKSDENKVIVEETNKEHHKVEILNNSLNITFASDKKWYEYIFNFRWNSLKITVFLKDQLFNNLKIKASTGSISIPNDFTFNDAKINLSTGNLDYKATVTNELNVETSTGNQLISGINAKNIIAKSSTGFISLNNVNVIEDIKLSLSTGAIMLDNVKANNLTTSSSTGAVELNNTIMNNNMNIETSTGSVTFNNSDSNTINVKTSTGSVRGTLLTNKSFDAKSNTGRVNVPNTTGGSCVIKSDTGEINITIAEK